MRIIHRYPLLNFVRGMVVDLPCPINISYLWNFGIILGICLSIQLVSGIFISMHYIPNSTLAFNSVEHIMRDVNFGWLLRYVHANGASAFFIALYIHIARGLFYGSYTSPRPLLWFIGIIIFVLTMGTGFIGYVLPMGQMSFWGATVITNMLSAIPLVGNELVLWVWGGYSVDNPTLNRFYSFHFLLPFIILALVIIHVIVLHETGSNNPLGLNSNSDKIPFHPYLTYKDILGVLLFLLIFIYFISWIPNTLGHSDNYIEWNPLSTPPHIVPEWYFLPFYAMLRAVPNKLLGVITMLLAIIILIILPYNHLNNNRSLLFNPLGKLLIWQFISIFILLGWLGAQPAEGIFIISSQLTTLLYFMWFIIPFNLVIIIYITYLIKIFNHNYFLKMLWIISPAIILLILSYLRFKLLYMVDNTSELSMIVKSIFHPWFGSSELDYNLLFDNDELRRIIFNKEDPSHTFIINELYILTFRFIIRRVKKVKFISAKLWDRDFIKVFNREMFPYYGYIFIDNLLGEWGFVHKQKNSIYSCNKSELYKHIFNTLLNSVSPIPNILYIYKFNYHISLIEFYLPEHFSRKNIQITKDRFGFIKSWILVDDKGNRILEFRSTIFLELVYGSNFLKLNKDIAYNLTRFYSLAYKYFNK